jgi:uncharacterized protein (DUF305 family)
MILTKIRLVTLSGLTVGLVSVGTGASAQVQVTQAGIEQARKDSVRRPYTAADIEFMSGMISHHAQAVQMAKWAESHNASKAVTIFCGRVATAQTAEIGLMQQWLAERRQPVPDADPRGMKMDMGGTTHFMAMPGMLTDEQMKQLDASRGTEFDRLFLKYMIQHHQGAVTMVQQLFDTNGAAQEQSVYKLASDVSADQTSEITRMQKMLASLTPGASGQ